MISFETQPPLQQLPRAHNIGFKKPGLEDRGQYPKTHLICLPYAKGLAKRIYKICSPYDIRTIFISDSILRRYLFWVKPPTEFNMIKNCVYSIPYSCGKIYKGETDRPLKVRLEEHRKAVERGEI